MFYALRDLYILYFFSRYVLALFVKPLLWSCRFFVPNVLMAAVVNADLHEFPGSVVVYSSTVSKLMVRCFWNSRSVYCFFRKCVLYLTCFFPVFSFLIVLLFWENLSKIIESSLTIPERWNGLSCLLDSESKTLSNFICYVTHKGLISINHLTNKKGCDPKIHVHLHFWINEYHLTYRQYLVFQLT